MKRYLLDSTHGLDGLKLEEVETPAPGRGEVLVRIRANSLNFRDNIMLRGGYPRNQQNPVVPLSDMAGEVTAIGDKVARFKTGDRVAANFMRDWTGGALSERVLWSSYGGGIDGFLSEYAVVPESALVHIPEHLSFEEASTLPCAALTAWNALTAAGTRAGDTVLLLGTGGVSIFGLQFARALGARAIITTSNDEKGRRARELGASDVINYRQHPDWHNEVRRLTQGAGVDHILEVGGAGTLERSLQSVRPGGTISLIGLLQGAEKEPSVLPALLNAITIRGIYVGSVEMFEAMNRAVAVNGIRPEIDRVFPFTEARAAYEHLASQKHLGKVVITHG